MENMIIRESRKEDARAVSEIYNYYVQHTVCSFETEPVSVPEMERRMAGVVEAGLPFYVGEEDGRIVGYCYLHPWKTKAAYDTTVETTVYLDPHYLGAGRGAALYERLLSGIDRRRIHALIACICLPNPQSVRLHERMGFRQISHFKAVGRKFDAWQDVGDWQLLLE